MHHPERRTHVSKNLEHTSLGGDIFPLQYFPPRKCFSLLTCPLDALSEAVPCEFGASPRPLLSRDNVPAAPALFPCSVPHCESLSQLRLRVRRPAAHVTLLAPPRLPCCGDAMHRVDCAMRARYRYARILLVRAVAHPCCCLLTVPR